MKHFLLILLLLNLLNIPAFAYEGIVYTAYLKGQVYQILHIYMSDSSPDCFAVFQQGRLRCLLKDAEIADDADDDADADDALTLIAIDKQDTPVFFDVDDIEEWQSIPELYIMQLPLR